MKKISLKDLEIHELANLQPSMTDVQFNAFKDGLESDGQLEPIKIYRGKVVDGRHRVKAFRMLQKENILAIHENPNQSIEDIENKIMYGWENRRHQTPTQKSILALNEYNRLNASGIKTSQGEIAAKLGSTRLNLSRAKTLSDLASREMMEHLFNGGKINIGDSYHPRNTDSLLTLINYFKNRNNDILDSSTESVSSGEFTDEENTKTHDKAEELIAEFGERLARKISNNMYNLLKDNK